MHSEYDRMVANLKQARNEGNKRKIKLWSNKLDKWRLEYGAHQPIRGMVRT